LFHNFESAVRFSYMKKYRHVCVEFDSAECASRACSDLDEFSVLGSSIKCCFAQVSFLTGQDKMCSGADLNDDNLRICRAYLQISDHCRVTVRVRNMVRVGVGVADCCIQTAGKSDKMQINHVIKTDEW